MEPNAELVLHWLDLLIVVSVLGFLWPAPFGWGATLLVGWVVSLFTGRPGSEKASRWTWFAIARRAHEE